MKKLLSILTIFALLVAVCAGCVPAEETAGNGDVPETTVGASVEDASAPTDQTADDPTASTVDISTESPTQATTDVKKPAVDDTDEEESNTAEIDFDELLKG